MFHTSAVIRQKPTLHRVTRYSAYVPMFSIAEGKPCNFAKLVESRYGNGLDYFAVFFSVRGYAVSDKFSDEGYMMWFRVALVTSMVLALTACGKGGVNDFKAAEATPVAELFEQGCAKCHGSDAGGKFGFLFKIDVTGKTQEQLAQTILSGREGMPSFPNLTPVQREALVAHIVQLRSK
jgi:mono/diheme cytochrome c family protein